MWAKRESHTYSEEQTKNNYPDSQKLHYWNHSRNFIVLRELERMGAVRDPILDIGCGRGIVVEFLRARGLTVFGCEPGAATPINAEVAPFLFFGLKAGELPPDFRGSIRTILLLDVIEHIEKPADFLVECLRQYTGAESFLVTVPAHMSLWSNYDERFGHFLRYDRRSVELLVRELPLRIVRFRQFYHFLYCAMRFAKFLGVKRPLSYAAIPPSRRWMHSILSWLFRIEDRVVPAVLPGSSLLIALKREH